MATPVPPADPTILGVSADLITAIATSVLAIATIFLVYAAWKQLPLLSKQLLAVSEQVRLSVEADAHSRQRYLETNTLRVCERYVSDVVVYGAAQRIWKASNGGADYTRPEIDKHDVITALNYLDGIAVGVKQGVFSSAIVKDHMESTFNKVVEEIILNYILDIAGQSAKNSSRKGPRHDRPYEPDFQ
jgi:hypothetical protein